MSIELSLTIDCKACGKHHWATDEDHGGLTFAVCARCKSLSSMVVRDDDARPPSRCACGGAREEWDHQTCPSCGAPVKAEWFQTWN